MDKLQPEKAAEETPAAPRKLRRRRRMIRFQDKEAAKKNGRSRRYDSPDKCGSVGMTAEARRVLHRVHLQTNLTYKDLCTRAMHLLEADIAKMLANYLNSNGYKTGRVGRRVPRG